MKQGDLVIYRPHSCPSSGDSEPELGIIINIIRERDNPIYGIYFFEDRDLSAFYNSSRLEIISEAP